MCKEIGSGQRVSIIWKRAVSLLVIVAMMVCYVPSDMFGIIREMIVQILFSNVWLQEDCRQMEHGMHIQEHG